VYLNQASEYSELREPLSQQLIPSAPNGGLLNFSPVTSKKSEDKTKHRAVVGDQ